MKILIFSFILWCCVEVTITDDTTKEWGHDISLSQEEKAKINAINDSEIMRQMLISAELRRKKAEQCQQYSMLSCGLNLIKNNLEEAYRLRGVGKQKVSKRDQTTAMPETMESLRGRFADGEVENIRKYFHKWNGFVHKSGSPLAQDIRKRLRDKHAKPKLDQLDSQKFAFSMALNYVFACFGRDEWLPKISKTYQQWKVERKQSKTLLHLLDIETLQKWNFQLEDLDHLNILHRSLGYTDELTVWSLKKDAADWLVPYAGYEQCPPGDSAFITTKSN